MFARILTASLALNLLPGPGLAAGAYAVGLDGDASHGFAFGSVYDVKNAEIAKFDALQMCRQYGFDYPEARAAAGNCAVVSAFTRQCFALALDPKPGTPGYGLATAGTQDAANAQAVRNCQQTSASDRKPFCAVDTTGCDTKDGDEGK